MIGTASGHNWDFLGTALAGITRPISRKKFRRWGFFPTLARGCPRPVTAREPCSEMRLHPGWILRLWAVYRRKEGTRIFSVEYIEQP
jgi:hypothetical protein